MTSQKEPIITSITRKPGLEREVICPAELLLDFVDIHGGVDGEIGIANGGARRRRQMPCRGAEFTSRTFERVGITVALGARHGKRDRKSTRLNSSHRCISYAVFC